MKKLQVLLASLFMLGGISFFSSCSKDDDKPQDKTPAEMIAGNYTNNLDISVMNQSIPFDNVTFTITPVTDETVDIIVPYLAYHSPIPSFTVRNLKVTKQNDLYEIAETDFEDEVTDSNGDLKTITGSMQGTYKNNELELVFEFKYGNMPMPMNGYFLSDKDK